MKTQHAMAYQSIGASKFTSVCNANRIIVAQYTQIGTIKTLIKKREQV